jgi:hypothetical protein
MQQFLKAATGLAGTQVVPAQLLSEFLFVVNDAESPA